jgi:hypothetical protein
MKRIHLILLGILLCAVVQAQELTPFRKGEKWGYRDAIGKVIVRAKYKFAYTFSEGLAMVSNKKVGFIDKTGKEVIPLKYDAASRFYEDGLAMVKLNGKVGFIDKTGKGVIPLKYDAADNFNKYGLARVKLNGKYGFIDKTGKDVIPPKYDKVTQENNLIRVELNGKAGFVDTTGVEIIPLKYDKVEQDHGLIRIMLNGKSGFVDKTGVEIIPLKYDYISKWKPSSNKDEYRADVWENGKYGEIDDSGKITVPFRYKSVRIQIVWENLLAPIFEQINAYRAKLPNSNRSVSFTIERPYLLVSVYNFDKYDIDFEKYSENTTVNKQTLDDVKTLIVRYDSERGSRTYKANTRGISVTNFASYLIYYDVIKKEIVGYDYLSLGFPETINVNMGWSGVNRRNTDSDIIKKIESHLQTTAQ